MNQQRESNNSNVKAIIVNGEVCDTPEAVCNGWAGHFGKLAEPLNCEQFEEQHLDLEHDNILITEKIVAESATPIKCISEN